MTREQTERLRHEEWRLDSIFEEAADYLGGPAYIKMDKRLCAACMRGADNLCPFCGSEAYQ